MHTRLDLDGPFVELDCRTYYEGIPSLVWRCEVGSDVHIFGILLLSYRIRPADKTSVIIWLYLPSTPSIGIS
jgi:hypothetical protein